MSKILECDYELFVLSLGLDDETHELLILRPQLLLLSLDSLELVAGLE